MTNTAKFLKVLLLISFFGTVFSASFPTVSHAEEKIPPFKKVVLVIFENQNFDKTMAQSFFPKIAKEGALLTNSHGVAHPSQPNYIALTSGGTQGVKNDDNYELGVEHLGNLLEAKGKTWKNYAEDFPGNCYTGIRKGTYARKHVPFMSYTDVTRDEKRCANIVDSTHFASDLEKGTLPDFSFFTPNMNNDGHDTNVAVADQWFKNYFGPLIEKPNFKDVLLIVTFDEDDCATEGPHVTAQKMIDCKGDTNKIYTVFYGRGIKPGSTSSAKYTHYSVLRTIEKGFGLSTLGKEDDQTTVVSGIWK